MYTSGMDPPVLLSFSREGSTLELRLDTEPFSVSYPHPVERIRLEGCAEPEAFSKGLTAALRKAVERSSSSEQSAAPVFCLSVDFEATELRVAYKAIIEEREAYTRADLCHKAEHLISLIVSLEREDASTRSRLHDLETLVSEGIERSNRKVSHFAAAGLPQLASAEAQLRVYRRIQEQLARWSAGAA
jgi:hypothetical protein